MLVFVSLLCVATGLICVAGLAFDKRVGGLYFWRMGIFGGSVYLTNRNGWNPTDWFTAAATWIVVLICATIIGLCLMTPLYAAESKIESKLHDLALWCQTPAVSSPAVILGVMAGLQGEMSPTDAMRHVILPNSDNVPFGECFLVYLTSEGA